MRSRLPALSPLTALSPRRRALAVGVASLAAFAAALVAVLLLPPAGGHGGAGPLPAQDRPGPVLLVPGYGGGTGGLEVLAGRIRATGRTASMVPLPAGGTGDLAEQARVLDEQVRRALRDGAPSVDLVGFSAGGVVARLWAHDHDGAHKARRVVTLGSPHHGARLAALGSAFAPDACPVACQQLTPGSQMLAGLDRSRITGRPVWLSIWTTQDEVVTPPESARLDGAVNVALQSVCPGIAVGHSDLPVSPAATALVLRALGPGPVTAPASGPESGPESAGTDCRAG